MRYNKRHGKRHGSKLSDLESAVGSDSLRGKGVVSRVTARFLFFSLWIIAASAAFAGTPFESKQAFGKWMTFYYQNPEPTRIPDAINYLGESGMLEDQNTYAPVFGFLSGVFRNNPDKMAGWVTQPSSLNENLQFVLILSIRYAALPDSPDTIRGILNQHPNLKPSVETINERAPITVESIPLEKGPWVLDALWGKFMATGESAPVERIMATLPWLERKEDLKRFLTGSSANWSLTSNAVQHPRVLEICEGAEKTQPEDVAKKLTEIVKKAKAQRQSQKTQ